MSLEMRIRQMDNGWLLTFVGHDNLDKQRVFRDWSEAITEIDEYFGWYDSDGRHLKVNPYP